MARAAPQHQSQRPSLMGSGEPRQESTPSPSSSTSTPSRAFRQYEPFTQTASQYTLRNPSMAQSSTPNIDANGAFSTQHADHVWVSWTEFPQDFLSGNTNIREPDKTRTARAAKEAIGLRTPKYVLYHPGKDGWSDQDHHVRFMAQIVTGNMLKGSLWSENDFRKRGLEITKAVYEACDI
ncbi:hypothetical protein PG993_002676 [Apiospora rasikravindrae]|uniref:Uncharacterized protein n=1 Tax=Apiospora rasikravindrae TaxID=990691 RepID=A0ABR1TZH7_9PEZI